MFNGRNCALCRAGHLGHGERLRRQDAVRAHRLEQAELSRRVQGLVVTLGAEGCEVWIDGEKTLVPPVKAAEVVDPTGCGDAWRGALLFGLEQGWPWRAAPSWATVWARSRSLKRVAASPALLSALEAHCRVSAHAFAVKLLARHRWSTNNPATACREPARDKNLRAGQRHATIHSNGLPHHIVPSPRSQVDRDTGHVVVHTDAPGRNAPGNLVAVVAGFLVHL
jgi:hypothetical protein